MMIFLGGNFEKDEEPGEPVHLNDTRIEAEAAAAVAASRVNITK